MKDKSVEELEKLACVNVDFKPGEKPRVPLPAKRIYNMVFEGLT
ncbi:MAG: hypothetical protein ACE5GD_05040 [Candidatus Geothermarchaeales archaeon]